MGCSIDPRRMIQDSSKRGSMAEVWGRRFSSIDRILILGSNDDAGGSGEGVAA